ncbi:MAG TPA: hypothetical protein PLH37_00955 [bacterium]|nr:hypothetical protein [bacterium]
MVDVSNQNIPNLDTQAIPGNPESSPLIPVVTEVKVHTMPDKFQRYLSGGQSYGSTGSLKGTTFLSSGAVKKSLLRGLVIGFLVIGALAIGAWLFIKSINQQPQTENNVSPVNNQVKTDVDSALVPEKNVINKGICSDQDCAACDAEQCRVLVGQCQLAIVYEPCVNNGQNECAVQRCQPLIVIDNNTATSTPTSTDEEVIPSVVAPDEDHDGLTDVEENIFGTNIGNGDTDGDSYFDGLEISNLYSPLKGLATRLIDSGLINNWTNQTYNYSVFYPVGFDIRRTDDNADMVSFFATSTEEFFQVLVLDNNENFTDINIWYLQQDQIAQADEIDNINIGGVKGVLSKDGLNVYVLANNKIFVISYNPGYPVKNNFNATFKMFLKSFTFFSSPYEDSDN